MRSTLIARIKGQRFDASARVQEGPPGAGLARRARPLTEKATERMRRRHGHSQNNKNSVLKSPGVPLVEHPCPKKSPEIYGQKRLASDDPKLTGDLVRIEDRRVLERLPDCPGRARAEVKI
jgi:hypothetical protein